MMGSLGVAVLAGRFITGYLLDRVWVPALAAVELSLPAISCLVLSRGVSHGWLTAAAVFVVGFASGAEFDLIPYCAARYFGMRRFGTIYAAIYTITSSAAGLAPPLFGWAFDKTGSYTLILEATAGCFVAGATVLLLLGPYPGAYNDPRLHTQPPASLAG
jgi:MFS family permease